MQRRACDFSRPFFLAVLDLPQTAKCILQGCFKPANPHGISAFFAAKHNSSWFSVPGEAGSQIVNDSRARDVYNRAGVPCGCRDRLAGRQRRGGTETAKTVHRQNEEV